MSSWSHLFVELASTVPGRVHERYIPERDLALEIRQPSAAAAPAPTCDDIFLGWLTLQLQDTDIANRCAPFGVDGRLAIEQLENALGGADGRHKVAKQAREEGERLRQPTTPEPPANGVNIVNQSRLQWR